MKSITIYPRDERQKFLLQSLLKEMKVHFKVGENNDESLLTEQEFIAKIDKSLKQAEIGKIKKLS